MKAFKIDLDWESSFTIYTVINAAGMFFLSSLCSFEFITVLMVVVYVVYSKLKLLDVVFCSISVDVNEWLRVVVKKLVDIFLQHISWFFFKYFSVTIFCVIVNWYTVLGKTDRISFWKVFYMIVFRYYIWLLKIETFSFVSNLHTSTRYQ